MTHRHAKTTTNTIFVVHFTGTVPDTLTSAYTSAALPHHHHHHHQYAGSLYSPTAAALTSNSLAAAAASIVAGKQVEGMILTHTFI